MNERTERGIPFRAMIPNAITVLALCFGLTGVRFAISEQWTLALAAIVGAGVLDGFDGRIARLLPAAHASVRPIDEVQVWNHRPEGAEALAAQWREEGLNARAVTALEAAVRQADIVSCATLATEPLVRGEWLSAGSHLDLIGSFTPAMREADARCFAGARTFIDTTEALQKAGDLLDAMAAGTLRADEVQGTLTALCRGECAGRTGSGERTVFKAVGSALEDLTAATLVWRHAGSTPA